MIHFKELSLEENKALLKLPVYVSLLAANIDGELDEVEKKTAIKFSHIKTFTCDPLLVEFYKETDKVFEYTIEQLDKDLPVGKDKREVAIKNELLNLEKIIMKLGDEYASTIKRSMESFKEHVARAHHSLFIDLIFPLPMPGLTD